MQLESLNIPLRGGKHPKWEKGYVFGDGRKILDIKGWRKIKKKACKTCI